MASTLKFHIKTSPLLANNGYGYNSNSSSQIFKKETFLLVWGVGMIGFL